MKTSNYCVTLKAESRVEAVVWRDAIEKVMADIRRSYLDPNDQNDGSGGVVEATT